ncbi:hypothetical protein BGZ60DRAFT_417250 [Tricladium varicosporioides]|nr:hypothetical protein BGZ60DRAFT_417250 [Hymenoscyphus varicosporioides]
MESPNNDEAKASASPKPKDDSHSESKVEEQSPNQEPAELEEGEAEECEITPTKSGKQWLESHNSTTSPSATNGTISAPPLPDEAIPPLPSEAPPLPADGPTAEDDGWAPIWEESAQAFYFYNRFTGATQWTNPRVPDATAAVPTQPGPPGVEPPAIAVNTTQSPLPPSAPVAGGYNPAIHGDYDPTAWYAQTIATEPPASTTTQDPAAAYASTAAFNRFTGRFQNAELTPENFNDENKSKRQMNAFFDVDAAANSHDGRSLKAERSGKKVSKAELKQFKEKRKAKKEEKRRAWLRD